MRREGEREEERKKGLATGGEEEIIEAWNDRKQKKICWSITRLSALVAGTNQFSCCLYLQELSLHSYRNEVTAIAISKQGDRVHTNYSCGKVVAPTDDNLRRLRQ